MFSASKTAGPSGYNIANSLRLRSSASAYLSRTESAGNRTTWTLSYWFKISPAFGCMFGFGDNSTGGTDVGACMQYNIASTGSGDFRFAEFHGGVSSFSLAPTLVLRDYSAWYHIVIAVDTTQATASNRIKMYLNGSQITSFSTAAYPSQNFATSANQAGQAFRIGCIDVDGAVAGQYFDGYLANINFIDGQALPPTAFGTFSKENGVWSPITYTGTYGTNGFKLNFSNGTSTTTLGYDSSGNGNNWTTNNISLTAGSTYDWMIDSPTKFPGSSYGVGNYAVFNSLPVLNASSSLSNGNLKILLGGTAGGNANGVLATIKNNSGKWYAEFTIDAVSNGNSYPFIGITGSSSLTTLNISSNLASYCLRSNGNIDALAVLNTAYGTSFAVNDVCNVAVDFDAGKIWYGKNGAWFASGNPSAGINPSSSGISSSTLWSFAVSGDGNASVSANFGQRPFAYTPPSGYKSLCTQNLPGVTIQNGAQYMAATTYTGNGSTQSISNAVNSVSFQPDFVWVKGRSVAYQNGLYDSVRGVNNLLSSNNTAAESTVASTVTAFASGGFSLGSNITFNELGSTFVGWQWKAGGTAVTNTAGSITSSVSANPTAGFSVVTYTMNGSASATIGHGLGVTPSMIIFKDRSSTQEWGVYHVSLGAIAALSLNTTGAANTWIGWFNNTAPTSTVMTLSRNNNTVGDLAVAYCFAAIPGYSAFGSYTGNGSTDGPFVYCGFRPRLVLVKCSSSTENWYLHDSSRDPYNQVNTVLYPNLTNAEGSSNANMDFLSNGFKIRESGSASNSSGATYIYAAFAENPFQNALAR